MCCNCGNGFFGRPSSCSQCGGGVTTSSLAAARMLANGCGCSAPGASGTSTAVSYTGDAYTLSGSCSSCNSCSSCGSCSSCNSCSSCGSSNSCGGSIDWYYVRQYALLNMGQSCGCGT